MQYQLISKDLFCKCNKNKLTGNQKDKDFYTHNYS